jgi:hypothetical protein
MSDANIALLARNLAMALTAASYSRAQEDWKEVMILQAELCRAVRAEKVEEKQ